MIVDIPNTTVPKISKKLQELRDVGGVVALGRVLTLVIQTDLEHIEAAIKAANGASRMHPSRIIVLADAASSDEADQLDAQIRVGGDAGASEVIVLKAYGDAATNAESLVTGLLLPDAPVVAWWPSSCSPAPAMTPIGQIASRRLIDSALQPNTREYLVEFARNYRPGDGDLAWTRITLWRAQLAALFELHQARDVKSVTVIGSDSSPSADLLAMWLGQRLGVRAQKKTEFQGAPVQGIFGVEVEFADGQLSIHRTDQVASIRQTGAPDSSVLLPRRSDQDCLVEDMRYLGEDEVFGDVLKGFLAQ